MIQARSFIHGTAVGQFVDDSDDNDYQLQCNGNVGVWAV